MVLMHSLLKMDEMDTYTVPPTDLKPWKISEL